MTPLLPRSRIHRPRRRFSRFGEVDGKVIIIIVACVCGVVLVACIPCMISENINPDVLKAMSTPDGGESVGPY